MTSRRRRWLSALLGTGLLVALLMVVSLDDLYKAEPPETAVLREVQMYEPPPPPPPPAVRPDSSSAPPQLALANPDQRVALEVMDLDVDLPAGQLGSFGTGFSGLAEGTGSGIGLVDLDELDELPMVVQAAALVYPEEAVDRGIDEFQVFVRILIDEQGRAYPVRVVQNPIPSFEQELVDYTSRVRFSPPTRLGVPVRTEYLWPLLIKRPQADR